MSIQKLFYPQGVAVIGSASPGKLGYELTKQLLEGGYPKVYAVNPKAQGVILSPPKDIPLSPSKDVTPSPPKDIPPSPKTVVPSLSRDLTPSLSRDLTAPGYDAVTKIGQPVDLAVIAAPASTVEGVLEDCGRAGVSAAIIITAGFSEVGKVAEEKAIKRVAQQYGIRFVGPNCAGLVNTRHNLFPTLETRPPAGEVAFVSQSGALGGAVLSWAEEQGMGFSKFVSYGNGADLNEIAFLHYLIDDPETKVGALYVESVSDGRAFMEAVEAFTRHKPLVVIKSGRTQSGQRATLSHTGSMAGADAVYDAALKQCGAIRVATIEEMFDLCKGFVSLPPVKGRRVVIVTNSGGPGVLAADRAEEIGLTVAEPSPALRAELSEFLPDFCALKNPIDLTVEGTEDGYRETLVAALKEYDAALALNVCPPYLDSIPLAQGVCDAARLSGKPLVANFMAGRTVAASLPYLKACDVPNYATGERAMATLAWMAEYEHGRTGRQPLPEAPPAQGKLPGKGRHRGQLLEPEAMAWLRDNGIPVPTFRFARDGEAAVAACREIGYPVVMKVVAPDILHKSDTGGVVLNIRDDEAAVAAFVAIQRAAAGSDFQGVVIYPMIHDAQEVLLGLSRDPQFGPVVAFGLGGIYTEVWRDIALRVAPVDQDEALAMIREIQSFPLLQGVRGGAPRDIETLAEVLAAFSRLPFRYPDIVELDLNPVFLLTEGLVVGDVRVIRDRA